MVGWHHQLDEREFDQAPGVGDGQGGLACCSPWGHTESDTTEATQQQQQHVPGIAVSTLKILTSKSSQSYVVETIILTLQMRKLRVKSVFPKVNAGKQQSSL